MTAPSPSPSQLPTPSSPRQHLRPSVGPSSPSSSIPSSLSDQDDYAAQSSQIFGGTDQPIATGRLPGLISLARRGSASSGRILQLGSVHSLGGELSVTPSSPFRPDGAEGDNRAGSRLGQSSSSPYSPRPSSLVVPAANSPHRTSAAPTMTEAEGLAEASVPHKSSHDSILSIAPGGVSSLTFPSPPARSEPHHARPPPPLPLKPAPFAQSPRSPHSPLTRAVPSIASNPTHHAYLPSQSSGATVLSRLTPNSPFSTHDSVTNTHRSSGQAGISTENHTFGHGTSSSPTPLHPDPNRLSAYDPLSGEISDVASYGSSPIPPSHFSPQPSPRSFNHNADAGPSTPSFQSAEGPARTRSGKSSKSSKSARSARPAKARSGSKRTSGSSLAYRLADLTWILRPGTPDEGDEGEALLDEGEGKGPGGGVVRGQKRKKSLRTIRREEQGLDLGKLLGRAAVLEKILDAGKRVSNQSLRFHPIRATDSPLPHPLPLIPDHHLAQPRRRPFSLASARTAESTSTHNPTPFSGSSAPPLPPIPTYTQPGRRQSTSFSSSPSKTRFNFGKRVKREGEWGGEGYTSLPASAAGSETHFVPSPTREDGGVMLFPAEVSPPTPLKPAYLVPRRLGREDDLEPRCASGCLTGHHHPAEIMPPPGCIPLGSRNPFYEEYRPKPERGISDRDRPLPTLPLGPEENDEKVVFRPGHGPGVVTRSAGEERSRRKSKVMSYVSTGQASWRSRRRWIVWIGVGCILGLAVVSAILGGVLSRR